jgi:gluconolactonase
MLNRRGFLRSAAAAAVGSAAAGSAMAASDPDPLGTPPPRDWKDPASAPYPDPAFPVFDPRMIELSAGPAGLRRIAWDQQLTEGSVYFADMRRLIWSDIPANKLYAYNEPTGKTHVFREPSNHANGNSRDWKGRLLTCGHDTRRVTRTDLDGRVTVLVDRFEGKRLNAPNDVVVAADGAVWFTDPGYGIDGEYEGHKAEFERPANVYRLDVTTSTLAVAADDFVRPNGIALSPDERLLYVFDSGITHGGPSHIRVFDVADGKLRATTASSPPTSRREIRTACVSISPAISGAA